MSKPESQPKTKQRDIRANYEDSLHQLVLLKERPEYCAFFEEWKTELYRVSDSMRIRSIAPEYDDYHEIELGVCTVIIPFLDQCWKRFGIIHPPLGFLRPPLEHLAAFLDPHNSGGSISDEDHHILARSLLHTFDSYQELADLRAALGLRPPDSSYARYKGRRRIPPDFDNHWVYALRCAGYTSGDIARGLRITEDNAEKMFLTHFREVHGREYDPEEDFHKLPEPPGWRKYLREMCGNCPLRFYLDESGEPYCKRPCKEINYYANKCSGKLRELRVKGGVILYNNKTNLTDGIPLSYEIINQPFQKDILPWDREIISDYPPYLEGLQDLIRVVSLEQRRKWEWINAKHPIIVEIKYNVGKEIDDIEQEIDYEENEEE
jgi:hypothetical protein